MNLSPSSSGVATGATPTQGALAPATHAPSTPDDHKAHAAAPPGPAGRPAAPDGGKDAPAAAKTGWQTLASDLGASLVVFLVAVPLSMGIALASGAPILSGLIAAAVGGIVAGILAGAPLQVSGPAAGLSVIVFGLIKDHGFAALCAMTLGAGLLQFTLGALRVGRLTMAISPAVIHGMLAAIGVVIALAQVHIILGGTPESSPLRNLIELPAQIADHHGPATFLGFLTVGILVIWPLIPVRALRRVPGPLVAVTIGTVVSVLTNAPVSRVELPAGLLAGLHLPSLPAGGLTPLLIGALTLALVASAESLLSAVATDRLHGGPRANLDRELCAQGAANTLSGLLGGLPVTGVIVRSTANVSAGAKTRWSAVLHGVWVILFVTQLSFLISRIPLCVLAGLLVFVGVRLVNLAHLREVLHHREMPIYLTTFLGVIFINLLAGIGLGIGVAVVRLLIRLARVKIVAEQRAARWHLSIQGVLTFLGVPRLTEKLASIPQGAIVDVDLDVDFVDHAGIEALHAWRASHERGGGKVDIDLRHESWAENRPLSAGLPEPAVPHKGLG